MLCDTRNETKINYLQLSVAHICLFKAEYNNMLPRRSIHAESLVSTLVTSSYCHFVYWN